MCESAGTPRSKWTQTLELWTYLESREVEAKRLNGVQDRAASLLALDGLIVALMLWVIPRSIDPLAQTVLFHGLPAFLISAVLMICTLWPPPDPAKPEPPSGSSQSVGDPVQDQIESVWSLIQDGRVIRRMRACFFKWGIVSLGAGMALLCYGLLRLL
jgi:hypothetical protein